MLETEEIDDDYFTPASSTSLANIFDKSHKDVTENESLKYTPPKPSPPPKPEEQRATQCIHACALLGYEWISGAYIARGKLGFAILKILKTGHHTIILYDSKKVTLSNMTISSTLEVTVKKNVYFSYRDNLNKYWCLYASEEELKKIINLLKSLNAEVIYSLSDDKEPPEISKPNSLSSVQENSDFIGKESDTDSSLNKKTKLSILNRMANMGQSVLPPRAMSTDKSSDSSDSNDYKSTRHKSGKVVPKRTRSDKVIHEDQSLIETNQIMVHSNKQSTDNVPLFTYVNGQIVPVTNTSLVSSSNSSGGNDINFFISEQRVNNSELRININRMSEKVDQVLGKISHIDNKDINASSSFQINIMQKLLSEYENKIRVYEEFLKGNKFDKNVQVAHALGANIQQQIEEKNYSDKINQLEQECREKDAKILRMEKEYEDLKNKLKVEIDAEKSHNNKLTNDIQKLNQLISNKNEELAKHQETRNGDDDDSGNKVKNIMNTIYHGISSNFENDEAYTGAMVKNITGTIIKTITIESLHIMQ